MCYNECTKNLKNKNEIPAQSHSYRYDNIFYELYQNTRDFIHEMNEMKKLEIYK